jgi:hypothetical protein
VIDAASNMAEVECSPEKDYWWIDGGVFIGEWSGVLWSETTGGHSWYARLRVGVVGLKVWFKELWNKLMFESV